MHERGASKQELLEMSQWFLVCVLLGLQQMHEQVSGQVLRNSSYACNCRATVFS
jgi:hypothetical protein